MRIKQAVLIPFIAVIVALGLMSPASAAVRSVGSPKGELKVARGFDNPIAAVKNLKRITVKVWVMHYYHTRGSGNDVEYKAYKTVTYADGRDTVVHVGAVIRL